MPNFAVDAIRTMALVGHGAAGKTTLAEALLSKAGAIGARQRRKGYDGLRFRSARKGIRTFACKLGGSLHAPRHARPPDRHAGLAGFPRPVAAALEAVETAAVVIKRRTASS